MRVVIIADKQSLTSKGGSKENFVQSSYRLFAKEWREVVVQCPEEAVEEISKIIPRNKIWTEPVARGTAPAVGLAASYAAAKDPREQILFVFANQIVKYQDKLVNTLKSALELQKQLKRTVLIGVATTKVTTDYGYIEIGKVLAENSGILAFEMKGFERSPDEGKVKQYTKSWKHLWDTGYMLANAEELLTLYRSVSEELFSGLLTVKAAIGTKFQEEIVKTVYTALPKATLAETIYEKMNKKEAAVVAVDLGRKDG
jgi:mannose-1-phosphate guanylyltransferase